MDMKTIMLQIRDVLTYNQLVKLRNFINEILEEKVENGYTK